MDVRNFSSSANTTQTLQQDLLKFLAFLQHLNVLQLSQLDQFILFPPRSSPSQKWDFNVLQLILKRSNPDQVEQIVSLTSRPSSRDDDDEVMNDLEINNFNSSLPSLSLSLGVTTNELETMGHLYQLFQLAEVLNGMSESQIMALYDAISDMISSSQPVQQLQILQLLQQAFSQLQPEALLNAQQELRDFFPGSNSLNHSADAHSIMNALPLRPEQYSLYAPLRKLLLLTPSELQALQQFMSQLGPVQMLQLLQLLQLPPFEVVGLQNTFSAFNYNPSPSSSTSSMSSPVSGLSPPYIVSHQSSQSNQSNQHSNPPHVVQTFIPQDKLNLTIVDQPPDKAVYKRNIKPAPTVIVQGEQKYFDSSLYIYATLIRCDTFQEESRYITGNKPVQVGANRLVAFKKLKVMVTSHQQGETLFCLKFELRRVTQSGEEFEVLHSMLSTPICLLSHSTQMKPIPVIIPTVTEVIPFKGPKTGTRVAIIGGNFVDSPAIRVKFDTTDVVPEYKGLGTLVCQAPAHQPGQVQVKVGNGAQAWSDTHATFLYEEETTNDKNREPGVQVDLGRSSNNNGSFKFSPGNGSFSGFGNGSLSDSFQDQLFQGVWNGDLSGLQFFDQNKSGDITASQALFDTPDKRGYTPLMYSVVEGNLEISQFLLQKGADPNHRDQSRWGNSALHWAILNGNLSIVKILLEKGASPSLQNFFGDTPLHWAVSFSNKDHDVRDIRDLKQKNQIENLVEIENNHEKPQQKNETPLLGGRVNLLKPLTDNDNDNNDHTNNNHIPQERGDTKTGNNYLKIASELIQNDSSVVNLENLFGYTPVHVAAAIGDEKLLDYLVKHGGFTYTEDEEGDTPLHIAVRESNVGSVKVLISSADEVVETHFHENKGNVKIAGTWVSYPLPPPPVSQPNSDGETPLHLAASIGDNVLVTLLLNSGSSPDVCDALGWTPLHHAVANGHESVVKTLLGWVQGEKSASDKSSKKFSDFNSEGKQQAKQQKFVNVQDSEGYSPLHLAVKNGNEDIVWRLICAGADTTLMDSFGATPMSLSKKIRDRVSDILQSQQKNNETSFNFQSLTSALALSQVSRGDKTPSSVVKGNVLLISNKNGITDQLVASMFKSQGQWSIQKWRSLDSDSFEQSETKKARNTEIPV